MVNLDQGRRARYSTVGVSGEINTKRHQQTAPHTFSSSSFSCKNLAKERKHHHKDPFKLVEVLTFLNMSFHYVGK